MEEKYNALKNKLLNAVQILACAGSVMLILSPVFQWIERIILYYTKSGVLYSSGAVDAERESVAVYQEMMLSLENIIFFMSKMILGALLLCLILNFEKVKKNWKKHLRAAMPLLIFSAYSAGIFIVTQIRGYSAYDLAVHPYRGSTMYDFMKYPFTYFLCGMLVYKGKYRKIVIYTFSLSSIVINSSALIHKWGVPNPCFNGWKSSGIFNNPNHFGYYLAIAVVCNALLFVYEDKMLYKVFKGANMALSMTALIMADSLGSALAVFMTLVMFGVYCWRCEKNRLKSVFAVYLILLLINIMMYSLVDTFFASIVQMVFDVGKIVNDSDDVDRVGSGRGELWRFAVEHIVRRPFTGWGVEGYEYGDTAHNEILQYAENFGIPVTLMYISAVTYVLTATFRRKKNLSKITLSCFCSTTSYLIGSLFGLALFNTLPFFYLFLGLTYAEVARSMILKSEKTETVTESGENAE